MIQEESSRPFYCPDNGRPNVPVAILTGLCILKELHNLSDQEVLGSLEFDLRWQYAFDINIFWAHICQKTLHNFRVLLTTNEQARQIFQGPTGRPPMTLVSCHHVDPLRHLLGYPILPYLVSKRIVDQTRGYVLTGVSL